MDNNNESMVCKSCGHGGMCCGNHAYGGGLGGGHHRFFILRMLLGIIILVIVFSVGVKVGELKGQLEGRYGDYGMMGGNYFYNRYAPGQPMPMMYYNNQAVPTTTPR